MVVGPVLAESSDIVWSRAEAMTNEAAEAEDPDCNGAAGAEDSGNNEAAGADDPGCNGAAGAILMSSA